MPLKDRKQDVFRYLVANGSQSPPSIRELCFALNIKSTSSMFHLLQELEKDGLITIAHGKRRNISIVHIGNVVQVPLLRMIHHGTPDFSNDNIEGYIPFDNPQVNADDLFAFRSLIDSAAIHKGDIVFIRANSKEGTVLAVQIGDTVQFITNDDGSKQIIGSVVASLRYFE